MKKRNRINPIEAHFEKVILAGVSVVLLGVVSMQFLTQPNAVTVGNSATPVPPGSAFDPIEKEAEALLAKMRDPTPDLPQVPEQNVSDRFEQARQIGLAKSLTLSNFGSGAEIEGPASGIPTTELAATVYALPALPAPASLAVATSRATLDPFAATANPALMAYLPAQQPFDAVAVSVEGVVDSEGFRESLETDPDGDGQVSPLPVLWWRDNITLLGVEVQREELTSAGWEHATVIAGMPGDQSLLGEARRAGVTANDMSQVVKEASDFRREIAQPKFPPRIAGPEWVRPSEQKQEAGLSEEDRQITSLKRRLDGYDRSIANLQKELEDLGAGGGGSMNDRMNRSGGGGRQGGGGRGGEGGGGGGGQATDPTQRRRESLERSLDATQRNRQNVIDQLVKLGVNIGQDVNETQQTNEPEPPLPDVLNAEAMPVWVHDFSAKPGTSYRYRMRVVVNNPLFGRAQFLSDEQKPLAASATMEGPWSAWSDPIEVERDRQYFVVSASEDDQLGSGPRAAVEVYEFYYGYWRRGSTTLSPGDLIRADTKLPENLPIWDPAKLKEMARAPANDPRSGRGGEGPGGGGRNYMPEGELNERRMRTAENDPGRGRQASGGQATEEGSQLPEGATAAPSTLEMDVDAMLLDVVRVPGAQNVFQAVLRGPDGQLVVRDASSERSGDLYKRLSANAKEGENQGRPEPEQNTDTPRIQPRDRRNYEDEGGGGGGGG